MDLQAYQQALSNALRADGDPPDNPTAVIREAVWCWARLQLGSLCPLTSQLLLLTGRLDAEVSRQLVIGHRPPAIHRWSHDFLARLAGDGDPAVAECARFELACVAPERSIEAFPDGWPITVDPIDLVADLGAGRHPHGRPGAKAWLRLERTDAGWALAGGPERLGSSVGTGIPVDA